MSSSSAWLWVPAVLPVILCVLVFASAHRHSDQLEVKHLKKKIIICLPCVTLSQYFFCTIKFLLLPVSQSKHSLTSPLHYALPVTPLGGFEVAPSFTAAMRCSEQMV